MLPDPNDDEGTKGIWCTNVIHRVRVCRQSKARYHEDKATRPPLRHRQHSGQGAEDVSHSPESRITEFLSSMDRECIGEVVPPGQSWYVDRLSVQDTRPGKKSSDMQEGSQARMTWIAQNWIRRTFTSSTTPSQPPLAQVQTMPISITAEFGAKTAQSLTQTRDCPETATECL